jgi:hypothetical protein
MGVGHSKEQVKGLVSKCFITSNVEETIEILRPYARVFLRKNKKLVDYVRIHQIILSLRLTMKRLIIHDHPHQEWIKTINKYGRSFLDSYCVELTEWTNVPVFLIHDYLTSALFKSTRYFDTQAFLVLGHERYDQWEYPRLTEIIIQHNETISISKFPVAKRITTRGKVILDCKHEHLRILEALEAIGSFANLPNIQILRLVNRTVTTEKQPKTSSRKVKFADVDQPSSSKGTNE